MFQKNERCFSAIGFEYEYVCPTTDGQHIVRPVLESEGGETVYGDLRQVDKVYTAEECDNQIVAGMVEYAARQKPAPVYGPEDHERCHYCHGLFLKPVEYHHSEQECALLTSQIEIGACKRLADEAQKKESGPLKVGDRVEVLDGVRSVSGRQVNGGTYRIDRVFHDGDIGLNDGSIVRASDVRRV